MRLEALSAGEVNMVRNRFNRGVLMKLGLRKQRREPQFATDGTLRIPNSMRFNRRTNLETRNETDLSSYPEGACRARKPSSTMGCETNGGLVQ